MRIADSIGTFQLGEQSEGRTLLRFAREFGAQRGCPGARPRHRVIHPRRAAPRRPAARVHAGAWHRAQAAQLDRQRVPADSPAGGLRDGGDHPRDRGDGGVRVLPRTGTRDAEQAYLRTICRQMCADEAIHLRYEAQLLRTLRGARPRWRRRVVELAHRTLLAVTARIVFREHRRVLAFAGHDARSFVDDCRSLYRTVLAEKGDRSIFLGVDKGGHIFRNEK